VDLVKRKWEIRISVVFVGKNMDLGPGEKEAMAMIWSRIHWTQTSVSSAFKITWHTFSTWHGFAFISSHRKKQAGHTHGVTVREIAEREREISDFTTHSMGKSVF
jgi:hypothetical protein